MPILPPGYALQHGQKVSYQIRGVNLLEGTVHMEGGEVRVFEGGCGGVRAHMRMHLNLHGSNVWLSQFSHNHMATHSSASGPVITHSHRATGVRACVCVQAGILCHHCMTVVKASVFEAHAGHKQRRNPYDSIIVLEEGCCLRDLGARLPPLPDEPSYHFIPEADARAVVAGSGGGVSGSGSVAAAAAVGGGGGSAVGGGGSGLGAAAKSAVSNRMLQKFLKRRCVAPLEAVRCVRFGAQLRSGFLAGVYALTCVHACTYAIQLCMPGCTHAHAHLLAIFLNGTCKMF
jgi:hypothetical protein